MRFHLVALPHTRLTPQYSCCAYTGKVERFARMMLDLGHQVEVYESIDPLPPEEYCSQPFDPSHPRWVAHNAHVIQQIARSKQPGDFLCVIAGRCQEPIARAHPDLRCVEFGVGYGGVFADFCVFESYAWMHAVYAQQAGGACQANGRFYDCVIPNYFDLDEFPEGFGQGGPIVGLGFRGRYYYDSEGRPVGCTGYGGHVDRFPPYYLYVGRLTSRKGVQIAEEACRRLGAKLLIAGPPGDYVPQYGEVLGPVRPAQRAQLMGGAIATFVPTTYVEPFGGVAVESRLCGTPVLTTDWGAFPELVTNGVDGYRCRTLAEFCTRAEHAKDITRRTVRARAQARFGMQRVASQYQDYFERLQTLDGKGWYS